MSGFGRLMAWMATLIVIATIAVGLYVVGSPIEARKEAADQKRMQDLSSIARAVRSYYTEHKKLPSTLDEVKNSSYLSDRSFTDPVTQASYEYKPLGDRFQLCATFEAEYKGDNGGYYYDYDKEFSKHPKGHYCFTLPAKSVP